MLDYFYYVEIYRSKFLVREEKLLEFVLNIDDYSFDYEPDEWLKEKATKFSKIYMSELESWDCVEL